MPSERANSFSHSSVVISWPSGLSQATSLRPASPAGTPRKKSRRRKIGCSLRRRIIFLVKLSSRHFGSSQYQSCQLISLSWQYALLLPFWVRPTSSPAVIIGTPWERSSVPRKLRFCCSRSLLISGSSVGPSAPWFHDTLLSLPSRLSSPLASLCFSLYETRSFSVKPSCAVMKFTLAHGPRSLRPKRSCEPVRRRANSPMSPPSPFQ